MQTHKAHRDAWSTEPALRAMACFERALDGMGLWVCDMLHGEYLCTVDRAQGDDTCVHCVVADIVMLKAANKYSTRATIALRAAFFSARQLLF